MKLLGIAVLWSSASRLVAEISLQIILIAENEAELSFLSLLIAGRGLSKC